MSFGRSPFGTSGFGGVSTPAAIVDAYAISTHEVLVSFTAPLQARSYVLPGDATNPSTWQVQRLDTGELMAVVAVELRSPSAVVVRVLDALPLATSQAIVSAPNLRDADGALVAAPRSATLAGITEAAIATPELASARDTISPRDLTNRPTPTPDGLGGGTLAIAGGDYTSQSGEDLLRKLIVRRLTAAPGDFYHLPDYGVGLRVKEPIPTGDLVKLKTLVERQIAQEPEVSTVTAQLVLSGDELTVTVAATVVATGQRVQTGVTFPVGG